VLRTRRRKGRRSCLDPQEVVGLAVLLPSTAWYISHPQDSCVALNSSIGAITRSTNSSSSSHSSSSSSCTTMFLPHSHSRHLWGYHSTLQGPVFCASTVERPVTSPATATSPRKATHHKPRHPWSISRGANRWASTMVGPHQLHHCGGDLHGERGPSGYVLPQ
jgi:hypothetical protein